MAEEQQQQQQHHNPIKYGDIFEVSENIADQPIAPLDAAAMQSAETQVLGRTTKGGPAAVMQSAARNNLQAKAVPPGASTEAGRSQGMSVTQNIVDGQRVITESIGDQVVARYLDPNPSPIQDNTVAPPATVDGDSVTIGEALEVTAISAGDKPITQPDAAAIQAAEMRATGRSNPSPGGLGAEAQSAVTRNKQTMTDKNKTTLGDILTDASMKLEHDKPATVQDAEKVIAAELRNDPQMETSLGGVGDSIAIAARLNQQKGKE